VRLISRNTLHAGIKPTEHPFEFGIATSVAERPAVRGVLRSGCLRPVRFMGSGNDMKEAVR